MLSSIRNQTSRSVVYRLSKRIARPVISGITTRFQSTLSTNPKEVYTKVNDSADPKRNQFFQYSWGSWLKDDKSNKSKRTTKFSIEGITKLVEDLNLVRQDSKNVDKSGEPFIKSQ